MAQRLGPMASMHIDVRTAHFVHVRDVEKELDRSPIVEIEGESDLGDAAQVGVVIAPRREAPSQSRPNILGVLPKMIARYA